MTTEGPRPTEPAYVIREGPLFLSSVYRHVGTVIQWDSIRVNLDLALAHDPTDPVVAQHIVANLWAVGIRELPDLVLLYEVHQDQQVVIYEALIPSLE